MSSGVGTSTALLPPVKSVVVYRNGDPFHCGRRFVVNQRQVSTMEAFLNDVTQNIQAPLAVRTLYTPRQGTRVRDLIDLQSGEQYVAAGFERFKKLNYLNSGQKKLPAARGEGTQVKVAQRPNVSAKWRKYIPVPCIIYVFRNGDLLCPPLRFIIPRGMQRELEQILSLVTERASLRTGAVRRLCTLEGTTLTSADQLETGHYYVAVGTERFKKLPYVELQVPKASERHFPGHRRQRRKLENRKVVSGPEDRYSDSALLDSPESDGRRVKSTGDEMGDRSAQQAVPRGAGKEESSIFFARPAKVRKNRGQPRPPPRDGAVQTSVFKGGVRGRREELQGAEEVQEDENTTVEIPVDQQVAETVEEEEHRERDSPRKGRKPQSPKETALTEPMNGGAQHQAADGDEPSDEKTRRQLEPQVYSSDRPSPQLDRANSSSDKVHHSPQTNSPSPDKDSPISERKSSTSGKASPISGKASPRSRRYSPPPKRNSPTSDQASLTSERNSPTSDQASRTSERNSRTSERNSPTSEKASPIYVKASPTPRRNSPPPERNSPTSDQASPTSERNSATSGKASRTSERNSRTSERNCPTSVKASPTPRRNSPPPERNSPTSDQASPTSERNSATSGKASRTSERNSATSGKASHTSERNSATSGKASRISERNSPTSGKASRTSERNSPTSGKASHISGKASRISGKASPISGKASPISGKASPISGKASLTSDQASHTSERNSPTLDRDTPIPDRPSPPPFHREHAVVDKTDASQRKAEAVKNERLSDKNLQHTEDKDDPAKPSEKDDNRQQSSANTSFHQEKSSTETFTEAPEAEQEHGEMASSNSRASSQASGADTTVRGDQGGGLKRT